VSGSNFFKKLITGSRKRPLSEWSKNQAILADFEAVNCLTANNFCRWCLINGIIRKLEASTQLAGKPTNRDLYSRTVKVKPRRHKAVFCGVQQGVPRIRFRLVLPSTWI
jgi:hypothetical protein